MHTLLFGALCCCMQLGAAASSTYTGNVLIQTPGDVANFRAAMAGVSILDGLLSVQFSPITNDDMEVMFASLTTITKSFFWNYNGEMDAFVAFRNLRVVHETFSMYQVQSVSNVDGFRSLTTIHGGLGFDSMSNLLNIEGLANLTEIGGTIYFYGCSQLTTIAGLRNVRAIRGRQDGLGEGAKYISECESLNAGFPLPNLECTSDDSGYCDNSPICANTMTTGSVTTPCPSCSLNNNNNNNQCINGGTCIESGRLLTCACPPNYLGDHCEIDASIPCGAGKCFNSGACVQGINGLECECTAGWGGAACDADANECGLVNLNNCGQHATCSNVVGSFACTCNVGYTGNGVVCADLDECGTANLDTCDAQASCTNSIGSFTCVCNAGFLGSGLSCFDNRPCDNATEFLLVPGSSSSNRICQVAQLCSSGSYEYLPLRPTMDRVCVPYDIAPIFLVSSNLARLAANIPIGKVITYISATAAQNWPGETLTVAFSLVDCGDDCPVSIDAASGDLTVARPFDLSVDGQFQKFYIQARDSRAQCTLQANVSLPLGCNAILAFSIQLVEFLSCPADVRVFVTDPTPTLVSVDWVQPTLDSFFLNIIYIRSSHQPGTQFSFGSTRVTVKTVNLDADFQLECSFQVVVQVGLDLTLKNVGHAFLNQRSGAGGGIMFDYLLDSTKTTGGGADMPLSSLLDVSRGFAIRIRPPRGNLMSFIFPAGGLNLSATFVVQLTWCESGSFGLVESQSLRSVESALLAVNSLNASVDLRWQSDLTSGYLPDGRCMRLKGSTTLPITATSGNLMADFNEFLVTLAAPTDVLGAAVSWGSKLFKIVQPSLWAAKVTGVNITQDAGVILFAQDVVPPSFVSCPSDFTISAPDYADSVAVAWEVPIARDNTGVPTVTVSHQTGSNFSVKYSPYTVVYLAVDNAGLTATCSFTFEVTFFARAEEIATNLGENDVAFSVTDAFNTYTASHHLMNPGSSVFSRFSLPAAAENLTVLEFVLLPPTALNFALVLSPGFQTKFAVDLRFKRNESRLNNAQPLDLPASRAVDAFATLHFDGIFFDSDNAPQQVAKLNSRDFFLNDFSVTKIDVSRGELRVKGETMLTNVSFRWTALRIRLNFPTGHLLWPNMSGSSWVGFMAENTSELVIQTVVTPPNLDDGQENAFLGRLQGVFSLHDVQAPVFSNCPGNISLNASRDAPVVSVAWTAPSVTDNVDAVQAIVVKVSQSPNSTFGIGTTRVIYNATDTARNVAYCTFEVTVRDVSPPILVCPFDIINVTLDKGRAVKVLGHIPQLPGFRVADNSGSVTVSGVEDRVLAKLGVNVLNITARDSSNLSTTCVFSVELIDTEAPVFSSLDCNNKSGKVYNAIGGSWTTPLDENSGVTDNFDPRSNITVTFDPQPNTAQSLLLVGDIDATVTAEDTSHNKNTCTYKLRFPAALTAVTSTKLTTAAAAGIGVGVGVLALIAVVFVVVIVKRRNHIKQPHDFNGVLALMDDIENEDGATGKVSVRELKRNTLRLLPVTLGKGNFGVVVKGWLQERHLPPFLVAVKVLQSEEVTHVEKDALLTEAALMAQFNHPMIVKLIGVVTAGRPGDPILLVLEFCEHGSLSHCLTTGAVPLTEKHKLVIAGDCAEGLAYLARKHCVHRDIAARNVLLTSDLRGKVSDFGLSRAFLHDDNAHYYRSKGGALPVRWTAPETLDQQSSADHNKFTSATDCWSFGVLLFEIFSDGALPYKDWSNERVWLEVKNGYRLPRPAKCPESVYSQCMLRCWEADASQRPSFQRLVVFFRTRATPVSHSAQETLKSARSLAQSSGPGTAAGGPQLRSQANGYIYGIELERLDCADADGLPAAGKVAAPRDVYVTDFDFGADEDAVEAAEY